MKAFVTGANGLIGANLVRALLAAGHHVTGLVRPESDLRSLENLDIHVERGDVRERKSISAAIEGSDLVFHLAATFAYSGSSEQELTELAVEGTRAVLEAANRAGVSRVVLTSSSVVFGCSDRMERRDEQCRLDTERSSPYARAKAAQEAFAFATAGEHGIDLVAVSPTMCLGPYDYRPRPSNGSILAYIKDPFKTTFPGGCNLVSVRDVAEGHIRAAERGKSGAKYILGSENMEWSMIHRMISEECGVPGPLAAANRTLSYLAGAFHEMTAFVTGTQALTTRQQARMVGEFHWYRSDRAREELGFNPRGARESIADGIGWMIHCGLIPHHLRAGMRISESVARAVATYGKESA